jgi:hypothetical protein
LSKVYLFRLKLVDLFSYAYKVKINLVFAALKKKVAPEIKIVLTHYFNAMRHAVVLKLLFLILQISEVNFIYLLIEKAFFKLDRIKNDGNSIASYFKERVINKKFYILQ